MTALHDDPAMTPSVPWRPLRVAFIADTMDGLGGGIVSAVRFVRALRERHRVTVIAAGDSPVIDVRLRGFQLPLRAMREMRFVFGRPDERALERAIGAADVVHLQYPSWLSFAALRVARRLGVPVVAAFHVQPENLLYNAGLSWRWLRNRLYRFWIRRFYERADAVVCPSAFAERRLREHGLTVPTHVVSNGTNPALLQRRAARDPRWRDRFVILGVGRLASAKLPHFPEIGWVSDARLGELYNSADLFVHASEVELEGMAVLEAASCGLPALIADSPESAATQFAAAPELLFATGQAADLAERIDALIAAPERLAMARVRAAEIAAAHAFEHSVVALENVYLGATRLAAREAASGAAEAVC